MSVRPKDKEKIDFQDEIIELLLSREYGTSICPSEILTSKDKQNKILMEQVRNSARQLAFDGIIEITQKNNVVDPFNFRGPIRLRLKKS
jgi:hypothetical protein